jgi:alkylation response protein AidB-like acyl-CoA dehydrogenase
MRLLTDPVTTQFRDQARTWLAENVPAALRPDEDLAAREFDCAWQRRQYEGGWAGLAWPTEFGGRGLAPHLQLIWYEELVRANAPGMGCFTVALGHAGPTIIAYGNEAQRARYLPGILRGDTPWCQGFSETGAGSDLASLRTSAEIDGDHLVINGQKIWTSYGHQSDFQELLVRTDPHAERHRGISWVIVDLHTPGITIRPIRTIDGQADFCECFYDDVRVPLANVVGELNDGWRVAMSTLSLARGFGYLQTRLSAIRQVDRLIGVARARNRLTDWAGYELARLRAQAVAVRALGYDAVAISARPDLMASANQVFNAEFRQSVARAALDILGPEALARGELGVEYLGSFRHTIGGGTTDIQKNILAKRVLGMSR